MLCKNSALLNVYNEVLDDMVRIGIKPGHVDRLIASNRYTVNDGLWEMAEDGTVSITIYMRNIPSPGSYSFRNVVAHEMLHAAANDQAGENVLHTGIWLDMVNKMNSAYPDKYCIQIGTILNLHTIEENQYFNICLKCGKIFLTMNQKINNNMIERYECDCCGRLAAISKDEAKDVFLHPERKQEFLKAFRERWSRQQLEKPADLSAG